MKALVIGKGGREHATVRAFKLSPSIQQIHVVPGNDGMTFDTALCHSLPTDSFQTLWKLIKKISIDLVVIGPEAELESGLSDFLREKGVLVFGPGKEAAKLEASKIFAKDFMKRAQIPTARFEIVSSTKDTMEKCESFSPPYVLKANGLAAGKGVTLCTNKEDLMKTAKLYFEKKIFGYAGEKALIEEFQKGFELSAFILTQGESFEPLPFFQDYKKLLEGDHGPNTGGMGAVGPLSLPQDLKDNIQNDILIPTVKQIQKEKMFYRGVLYIGLMVTKEGPKVIEYNVRFGDPETQCLLPLLDGDWAEVMASVARGELPSLKWRSLFSACIVLAGEGYPEKSSSPIQIEGDPLFQTASSYFLHAGTKKENGKWVTHGGRILNALAIGSSLEDTLKKAYAQAEKVSWKGRQMRKDIGQALLETSR